MTVYISLLMFMNMDHFTFSSLVLRVYSLLVILNSIKFSLQNKITTEIRILASKILTEERVYF